MSIQRVIEQIPTTEKKNWSAFEEELEALEQYYTGIDYVVDIYGSDPNDITNLFHPGRHGEHLPTVVNLRQRPIFPPSILKRVYTLYHKWMTPFEDQFYGEQRVQDPFFTLCANYGSLPYTMEHLQVMHDVNPKVIHGFCLEPEGRIDYERSSVFMICKSLPEPDNVSKVFDGIRWITFATPLIGLESFDAILEMVDKCLIRNPEEDVKSFVLEINAKACVEKLIHGKCSTLLHLLVAAIPPYLDPCCDAYDKKALRKFIKDKLVPEFKSLSSPEVSIVDICLSGIFLGDNLELMDMLLKLQPDTTHVPLSGLPLFAAAAGKGRSLDVIYKLLSEYPDTCVTAVNRKQVDLSSKS